MASWLRGILLGFILVLPGMSGGTVFLIYGIYESLISDLAKLNIRPYYKLFGGVLIGFYLSGSFFSYFFEIFRDETAVFMLGCLLASVRAVIKNCPSFTRKRFGYILAGVISGFLLGSQPIGVGTYLEEVNLLLLFLGGAFSSATMVIPGLPGSSVLIAMGIYDNVLYYLSELVLGYLLIFSVGALLGMFLLVKVLAKIYTNYRGFVTYFFAGLIVGSGRALIPETIDWVVIVLFLTGFVLVWKWSENA